MSVHNTSHLLRSVSCHRILGKTPHKRFRQSRSKLSHDVCDLRERERDRERERERERGRERERRERERNVIIGNSTSWITNILGAKYKIQVTSNYAGKLHYVQIQHTSTVPQYHAIHMKWHVFDDDMAIQ